MTKSTSAPLSQEQREEQQSKRRYNISQIIIFSSLSILILISIAFIAVSKDEKTFQTVFTAIVGLVGAWVGTVLAFYFSKDNFDAASKSTNDLVKQIASSSDKLKSINAEEIMMNINTVKCLKSATVNFSNILLVDLLNNYLAKHNRLPVLDEDNKPVLMIHRSLIDKFLAENAVTTPGTPANTYTLDDLYKATGYKKTITQSFVCVLGSDPLLNVKKRMEFASTDSVICSDIFVTKDGTNNSAVLGWITNNDLSKHSQI